MQQQRTYVQIRKEGEDELHHLAVQTIISGTRNQSAVIVDARIQQVLNNSNLLTHDINGLCHSSSPLEVNHHFFDLNLHLAEDDSCCTVVPSTPIMAGR